MVTEGRNRGRKGGRKGHRTLPPLDDVDLLGEPRDRGVKMIAMTYIRMCVYVFPKSKSTEAEQITG